MHEIKQLFIKEQKQVKPVKPSVERILAKIELLEILQSFLELYVEVPSIYFNKLIFNNRKHGKSNSRANSRVG